MSTTPMISPQKAPQTDPAPPPVAPQPAAPVNHGHNLLRALVNGAHQVGQLMYDVNNPDLTVQRHQQLQDQLKQLQQQHDEQYRKMVLDSIPGATPEQQKAAGTLLTHFGDPNVSENDRINGVMNYFAAYAPKNLLTPEEQAHAARVAAKIEPSADVTYKQDNPAPKAPKGKKFDTATGQVEDLDTGKRYSKGDADVPPDVAGMFQSQQNLENDKQARLDQKEQEVQDRFNKSQERIASQFAQTQANLGTWTVAEGEDGKTMLLNSKTGEMKDAPGGLHKSGYYAKNIAPLEAASSNIDDYINGKVFDGPGDLTLQHEFFTATQPATGFRMTKVQQDILADSQSWLNSLQAKAHHFATGTWFSDKQREQIAKAAKEAIDAKKKALAGGDPDSAPEGPQTKALKAKAKGGADSDPLGILK